ncbi:hypothetical protein GH5_06974 [Leishmania sp. Ghana 2012 LV757]|uniref:hypothetical protein n=1 Tax=Leishmania sp. Ghana 2012 LV757 TaxID=2803181 RepID=UPI001B761708|nr:hypothetical protein GH5_06974 [Leishmania sp. Ghana 2012 LV757]
MAYTPPSEAASVGRAGAAVRKVLPIATPSRSAAAPPLLIRTGAVLPREIFAWLQSLQLGCTVKYPKRDLANGYVIAHICARYWPHVPLHSFENKTGTASRQSNWFVLRKVLRQHGVEVSAAMVDGMMSGADGCAGAFLQQLYTALTGKHVNAEAVSLENTLPEVPASKVPVYVPNSTGGAAARTRHTGGANGLLHSTHVDSRSNVAGRRGKEVRSTSPVLLPPLPPPLPMMAHMSPSTSPALASTAEGVAAGKPLLNVSVRAAGKVSTVLPVRQTSASATSAPIPPQGSSLAGAWFCTKVCESVPSDAAEGLMEDDKAAAAPTPSLSATLRWLSACPSGEGCVEDVSNATLGNTGKDSQDPQIAVLRMGVWQAIVGAVPELAQILVHTSGHGLDVLVDCLFASVKSAQFRLRGAHESDAGDNASYSFVRNALHFSAALLATLSGLNVHHAVACFETYFAASPNFSQALRGLHWPLAADYAELILAVLPPNRRLAASVLTSLWESIEHAVRDSAAEETALDSDANAGDAESGATGAEDMAEVCLLVLLRALLDSIPSINKGAFSRTPLEAAISNHTQIDANAQTSGSSVRRTAPRSGRNRAVAVLTSQDAVTNALVQLAQQRSVAALQRAAVGHTNETSAGVDEATAATEKKVAAAALAVQVLRVELRPSLMAAFVVGEPFFCVYNALFPLPGEAETPTPSHAPSPTLSVLRARWIRWCLQRRFELGLSSHSPTASAAAISSPSSPHPQQQHQYVFHSLASSGPRDEGDRRATTATPTPLPDLWVTNHETHALLSGVQALCRELSPTAELPHPAEAESRLLVGCALAESLLFLPAKYKTESANAECALTAAGTQRGGVASTTVAVTSDTEGGDEQLTGEAATSSLAGDGGDIFAEDAAEAALKVLVHDATPAQIRSILGCPSKSRADAAAPEGEALEDEAAWMAHRYVGPLNPSGLLVAESDALLLVKAALSVLGSGGALPSSPSSTGDRDLKVAGSGGGLRRLAARAAVVAREGQVEGKVAERVQWLARLLVEGRANVGGGAPLLFMCRRTDDSNAGRRSPSSLRENTALVASAASEAELQQWRAVLSCCYEDLLLVIQAASMRLRQRGGAGGGGSYATASVGRGTGNSRETVAAAAAHLSEAVGKELLMLAPQAEGVVCTLWRELAPYVAAPEATGSKSEGERLFVSAAAPSAALNSAFMGGPLFSFLENVSQEELVSAVYWICAVCSA